MIVTVNTPTMESSQNDRQIFGGAIISEIRLLLSLKKISELSLIQEFPDSTSRPRLHQISALVNLFGGLWWRSDCLNLLANGFSLKDSILEIGQVPKASGRTEQRLFCHRLGRSSAWGERRKERDLTLYREEGGLTVCLF